MLRFSKYSTKKVSLIVNGNQKVAEKIDADGYHISYKDLINNNIKYHKLLGVSVHSIDEAILAENKGADYILASHIYHTKCKNGFQPKGTAFITAIKKKVEIPVIALGGINPQNVRTVYLAGADGVAVMSYVMASEDPYKATINMSDVIKDIKNNKRV